MFRVFGNAWKIPDLKKKILFTVMVIVLYRLGSAIPVPYIDGAVLSAQMEMPAKHSSATSICFPVMRSRKVLFLHSA